MSCFIFLSSALLFFSFFSSLLLSSCSLSILVPFPLSSLFLNRSHCSSFSHKKSPISHPTPTPIHPHPPLLFFSHLHLLPLFLLHFAHIHLSSPYPFFFLPCHPSFAIFPFLVPFPPSLRSIYFPIPSPDCIHPKTTNTNTTFPLTVIATLALIPSLSFFPFSSFLLLFLFAPFPGSPSTYFVNENSHLPGLWLHTAFLPNSIDPTIHSSQQLFVHDPLFALLFYDDYQRLFLFLAYIPYLPYPFHIPAHQPPHITHPS